MKNVIVFDSSTLILLSKISLSRNVTNVTRCIITDIVEKECTRKDTYDSKIIKELIKENLLETVKTGQKELVKIKKDFNIQHGEASSLALALKKRCILATDDKPTIKACIILNVDFSTAIHFVVRSYKTGLIDRQLALEKVSSLERYGRYNTRIIEDAKKKVEGD